MGKVIYKGFRADLVAGNVTGAPDIRVLAVMTGSTAEGDEDATTISGIGTLNEFDGSGYTRLDLSGVAIASDDTNDRHEITASAGSFGAGVGAGSDEIIGFLYYRHVGADSSNVPWLFNDDGCPVDPSGGALDLTPAPDGIIQLQS